MVSRLFCLYAHSGTIFKTLVCHPITLMKLRGIKEYYCG